MSWAWVDLLTALLALGAITLTAWVYFVRQQWRIWTLARRIPGPKTQSIIFGHHSLLMYETNSLHTMMKLFDEFGPVVRIRLGPFLKVTLKDPDDIQLVLGNSAIRNRDGHMTRIVEHMYGNGLLTLRDDKWKKHRKIVTPTFHTETLKSFVEVFGRKAAILTEKLREVADGRPFNISHHVARCTMDSICETFIGTTKDTMRAGTSELVDGIFKANSLMIYRVSNLWLVSDLLYALTSYGREAKRFIKLTHEFSQGVISQKLEENRQRARGQDETASGKKKMSTFLDVLINESEADGSVFSPEDLRDEVTQMVAAGLGTTAVTISTLLMLVAINSEVQDEICQELHEVFGSDSRPASWEDLQSLPLMDRCIKETLRLFPVVAILPREISQDIQLPSGYTLPAGSSVQILSYATHRDPRYYPNPNKFWPDRWLPENIVDSHPYAYLPFSSGPRNCIGQRYAQLQMKSILSQVLREFRASTDVDIDTMVNNLKLSMVLTISDDFGYSVSLTPRN